VEPSVKENAAGRERAAPAKSDYIGIASTPNIYSPAHVYYFVLFFTRQAICPQILTVSRFAAPLAIS
jgi:hypothetical protein